MVRRTYESDAAKIEDVDDLDDLVADKREAWRATSDKARRRQRRYKKRLTNRLVRQDTLKMNSTEFLPTLFQDKSSSGSSVTFLFAVLYQILSDAI